MRYPLVKLGCLLLIKALIMSIFILYGGIGLGPDEAQYWTWSQDLSWGYYSKPPAIAWQIWFGTKLFGNTELGVRFGSLVLGTMLPLAVYWLSREAGACSKSAFWAGVTMALTPLGFLSTFFAITDVGVVLFFTLTLIPVVRAIKNTQEPSYIIIGIIIACGALFKWQIYVAWLLLLPLLYFFPVFRSLKLLLGSLISLLGLFPSFVWNFTHDFATFRHVFATVQGAEEGAKGNVLEFIGAQAGLLSPLIFLLLLYSFWKLRERQNPDSLRFLGLSCLVILAIYCFFSVFKKMQGNWCDYAYPAGIVWLCYSLKNIRYGIALLIVGLFLSLVLTFASFSIPTVQKYALLRPFPYKINPFKHNLGWDQLEKILADAGYRGKEDFLFSGTYQMTSELSFYNPLQKRAYFFNVHHIRKNQFSYWPQMRDEQLGKSGFFVAVENGSEAVDKLEKEKSRYKDLLEPYFRKVEPKGVVPLYYSYGKPVKAALIFKAIGYNGRSPEEEDKY